jgi:hypothetical protein
MKSQVVALRVASVMFGLACLAFLARLLARLHAHPGFHGYMHPGFHRIGFFPILVGIVFTGILSVWMWSISSIPPKAEPSQSG